MPSQELLNEFSRFNDEMLLKLLRIGDSILSPLETELTSADFASMLEQVFKSNGLADRFFPEWTDRTKSDFGTFLVELFALFSDKDFFYINHYHREAFAALAETYRSIMHKALTQGFNPPSNRAASGEVELIFAAGNTENVPRGSIVLGISEMPDLVYTNDAFTIPNSVISQSVTATFRHGKLQRDTVTFDGYSIVVDNKKIVTQSIELTINNEVWAETGTFLGGTSDTKHFMVFYSEEGRAEIIFAKGGLGAVPDAGSVCTVEYLVGGGYIGDIMENTINLINNSQTNRNLQSYTQYAMTGGNDMLPMEELRQTVIGKARTQERIVTPEDAQYFCKELSFVHKVYATVFGNYIYVYVLPVGGGNVSPAQVSLVEDQLNSGRRLMGYQLNVSSPIYVPVTASIDLYLTPNTSRSGTQVIATQVIEELLNPLKKGNFGEGVKRGPISSELMQRVRGLQNAVFSTLHRSGTPLPVSDLTFLPQEVVDYANSTITINIIGGI